jgi:hypothetical protein
VAHVILVHYPKNEVKVLIKGKVMGHFLPFRVVKPLPAWYCKLHGESSVPTPLAGFHPPGGLVFLGSSSAIERESHALKKEEDHASTRAPVK